MSFVGVAAGIGAATGVFKIAKGAKQDKLANSVVVPEANYETSPYAIKMLEEANRIKDGRMAGAADAERAIYGSGANAMGAVGRNSTSGAQSLAMLAAINGNTGQAFNALRAQEGNDFWMKQNAVTNAGQIMIREGDKNFQDEVRKRQEAIQEKSALRGAATQNMGGGVNDILNNAFMFSSNLPDWAKKKP